MNKFYNFSCLKTLSFRPPIFNTWHDNYPETRGGTHFAVPLASRIHEGLVHSDIPKQTLSEKMIALLKSLKLDRSFYLVLDAFYSNRKIIKGILGMLEHLVVRIRNNAVAYYRHLVQKNLQEEDPRSMEKK